MQRVFRPRRRLLPQCSEIASAEGKTKKHEIAAATTENASALLSGTAIGITPARLNERQRSGGRMKELALKEGRFNGIVHNAHEIREHAQNGTGIYVRETKGYSVKTGEFAKTGERSEEVANVKEI
ncbi:MAG: hypothetical protein DWQ47_01565 [Acidobacteria bacterium]|nr:MAG: hypothetical protein DWQ32_12025 [Acidobacteriota bacterium]REK04184.1 MAG: hypothetical protein DWQ38_01550 [Acidobacteriota bacterium]REK15346.1 MAG: hypothetical protein DWQ43_17715 [Acidobacteriota bacterium]REK46436.1 MAG: hypothetical protein DWQ47_01565 [Acidobacteriota bacterium]